MKESCDNPRCDNPTGSRVPVSVERPSDQTRALCASCEEAYTWGVQHGGMSLELNRVDELLLSGGFALLTNNRADPSPGGPFEAWAYQGPLDLGTATPVTFGVGTGGVDALRALDSRLGSDRQAATAELSRQMPLLIDERELATILAALRFHQDENLQVGSGIPDKAIGEIATDAGVLEPLTFDEVEKLCQRLNLGEGSDPRGTSRSASPGMAVDPPPEEDGREPLFRVLYIIDVNASDAHAAAACAYRIMSDPVSMHPVLHIIDNAGSTTTVDLSEDEGHNSKGEEP